MTSQKLTKESFNNMTLMQAAETIASCVAGNLGATLEEGKLRNAIAAGALAAAAVTSGSTGSHPTYLSSVEHQSDLRRLSFKNFAVKHDARAKKLSNVILDKYSIGSSLALKIAKLALKYEKPTFPKAADILALCGIESSFKPHAVSQLENDPAVGLMQVRPAVWGIEPQKLKSDIEEQIKTGSTILHGYYQKLKSKDAALQAYNVGLTNYMKKKGLNPRYVPKFNGEREMYESLEPGQALKATLAVQQMFDEQHDFETEIEKEDYRTGTRHNTRYKLSIKTPLREFYFRIDEIDGSLKPGFQGIEFCRLGRYAGSSSHETYNFDTIDEVLAFVKRSFNQLASILSNSDAYLLR